MNPPYRLQSVSAKTPGAKMLPGNRILPHYKAEKGASQRGVPSPQQPIWFRGRINGAHCVIKNKDRAQREREPKREVDDTHLRGVKFAKTFDVLPTGFL